MVNERAIQLREIAEFISTLPHLTSRYSDIEFIDNVYEMGQNSVVLRARDGRRPVILKFDGPWNNPQRRAYFEREYSLMRELSGKDGIIQLRGDLEKIELDTRAVEDGPSLPYVISYFPMEVARVDLATLIYLRNRKQSVIRILIMFQSLCRSLKVLHENSICHRDLKPSNIFVNNTKNVKIGDLGCARKLGEGVTSLFEVYSGPRGDARYIPLELLCTVGECDEAFLNGDFYGLGAVLFEMITGKIYGEYVFSLEYLLRLREAFKVARPPDKEDVFNNLLPDIIEAYPQPSLSDLTGDIPASIRKNLDRLYMRLTEIRAEKRLIDVNIVIGSLEIMIRRLRFDLRSRF